MSEACVNCWARTMHERFHKTPFNVVRIVPSRLDGFRTLQRRRARREVVFVGNTCDLFHEEVPLDYIVDVLRLAAQTPGHTFLFLTKRAERMRRAMVMFEDMMSRWTDQGIEEYTGHMWMGVTAENDQRWADRVPTLLETPAGHRWVSAEPLLGSVDPVLKRAREDGTPRSSIDLVVAGFESGPRARRRRADAVWAYQLKTSCQDAHVRFHWKQWGDVDVMGDPEMRCVDDMTRQGDCLDHTDYSEITPNELWSVPLC